MRRFSLHLDNVSKGRIRSRRPLWLRGLSLLTSATFVWTSLLALPAQVLARDNQPKFGLPKPIPVAAPHDDPAWHTIDYHAVAPVRPAAARKAVAESITLLDEVARLAKRVSAQEAAQWKQELHRPSLSVAQAATAHIRRGEYELVADEQPEQAEWHFAQARKLTAKKDPLYGLAAYDSAQTLFVEGAYVQAAAAFRHLLSAKPALHGFNRNACTANFRDANACAGYHAEREKMGIPEPPRLDPLCAAAALAQSLKTHGHPFDKKTVLTNMRVTGRGSNILDVVTAANKLHMDAQIVTADDKGLMALPKPLICYAEHDHFLSVLQADKEGVAYLCSDCGKWPGGRVNLSWRQWHKLEATHYVVVSKPASLIAQALPLLQRGQKGTGTASGLQFASTRLPQMDNFRASFALAKRLRGHVVCQGTQPGTPSTPSCGSSRQSRRSMCPVPCPTHSPTPCNLHGGPAKVLFNDKADSKVRGLAQSKPALPMLIASAAGDTGDLNHFGAQAGDPVNLASGEEEFAPEPDLVVYNPSGPPIVWTRTYNSLWGTAACPDFGMGWASPYRMQMSAAQGQNVTNVLIMPNAVTYPINLSNVPTSPNPALWPVQGSFPAGVPMLVRAELEAPPQQNGASTAYHLVITGSDRTQFVTSPIAIGSQAGGNTFITQSVDRNRNSLYFNFVGGNLVGIKGSLAPLPTGVPLGTVPSYMPPISTRTLLTVARDNNNCISHVDDCYGRSVYYHVSTYTSTHIYPSYPQTQQELDHVSQVVTTGTASPPDRYVYGYTNITNGEIWGGQSEAVPYLTSITVPSPTGTGTQTASIHYDPTTNVVTSLVDANGNSSNYNYVDANHTQIIQKDPQGNIVYRYTVGYDMNMSETTVTNGTVDGNGNNTQIIKSSVYADPNDPYKPSQVQDGNGYAAGGLNNLGTWTYSWDQFGHCLTSTTPRGTTTTNTFSAANFALSELTKTQTAGKQATTFAYFEPSGNLQSIVSPLPGTVNGNQSVTTSYTYSALGNPLTVTTPGNGTVASKTTTYNYTTDGNFSQNEALKQAITVTDNIGKIIHLRFDSQGRVTQGGDALGNINNASYNIIGQIAQTQLSPTGQTGTGNSTIQNTYLYPGGPLTNESLYDESGNLARHVTPVYGAEGEQLTESGDVNPITTTYDGMYRTKTLTDGNTRATQTSFNSTGYTTSSQMANANTYQATSWDNNGNVLSGSDAKGVIVNYIYNDVESQITDVQYPATPSLNVHITYDNYGRTSSVSDSTGNKAITYDDLGLPLSMTTNFLNVAGTGYLPSQMFSYAYNSDSSRSSMTTPGGSFSYSFDGRGLPSSVSNPFGETFSWTYLDNGWLWKQQSGSAATAIFTYNALGQTTELAYRRNSNNTLLSDFSGLTHDAVGNRLSQTASLPLSPTAYSGSTSYSYDNKDQLTAESSTRSGGYNNGYGFDLVGNPTTWKGSAQTFNSVNQNTQGGTIGFDANGNPQSWNGAALTFDANNKLTSIGTVLTAGYGSDGLRAWKQTSAGRTYFLYDGLVPVCELDSSGNVTVVTTTGVNGIVARHVNGTGGGSVFYAFDPQGSVAVRLDTSGNVLSSHVNEAWGTQVSSGTGYASDPYAGYGGQWGYYRDAETGLHLCGHRYYDASSGRFLNRDPIGYAGGINLYGYGANNPFAYSDPSGNSIWSIGVGTIVTGGILIGAGLISAPITLPILVGAIGIGIVAGSLTSHYGEGNDWGDSSADGVAGAMIGCELASANWGAIPITLGGRSAIPSTPPVTTGGGGENQVVSRWGRPGLQNGDWVMLGPATYWNWLKSGKFQPGMTNEFCPFKNGEEYTVPKKNIFWPDDGGIDGWWKGLFGQRQYVGHDLPPPPR